jgi:hypothetical protein
MVIKLVLLSAVMGIIAAYSRIADTAKLSEAKQP